MADVDITIRTIDKSLAGSISVSKNLKGIEKSVRDTAVVFGSLTKAEADALKPTQELVFATQALRKEYFEGAITAGELNREYTKLAKATLEVQEATEGATEEQEGLGKTVSKVRTQWGKVLFVLGAVAGTIKVVTDAFKDYIKAAEDTPELFSPTQLARAKALGESTDDLGDSFTRLKIQMVDARAEGVTKFITSLSDAIDKSVDYAIALSDIEDGVEKTRLEMLKAQGVQVFDDEDIALAKEAAEAMLEYAEAAESSDKAMLSYAGSASLVVIENQKLVSQFGGLLAVTEEVGRAMESYTDKQDNLAEKVHESRVEIGKLIIEGYEAEAAALEKTREELEALNVTTTADLNRAQWLQARLDGYSDEAKEIVALRDEIAKLDEAYRENTEEFEMSTNRRILKRAEEILAANDLTLTEELALLERGKEMGVYTEEYVEQAQRIINESQAIADAINIIPTQHTTTLTTVFETIMQPLVSLTGAPGLGPTNSISDFIVPPGVTRGERVNVETIGQQNDNSSPSKTINVFVDTLQSREDLDYLAQEIGRRIQ